MNRSRIKKLVICAILADIAVVGSMFSFPILGSRCAPIQHMVNISVLCFSALPMAWQRRSWQA